MPTLTIASFDTWRTACRGLLAGEVPPSDVHFADVNEPGLFGDPTPQPPPRSGEGGRSPFRVPKPFLDLAEKVACHRDPQRWPRLYRALWRITHGAPHLLDLATDDDVHWLLAAEKQVRRDSHKMKAFVRFRKVGVKTTPPPGPLPEAERGSLFSNPLRFGEGGSRSEPGGVSDSEHYVAWHRPDHRIVRLVAPFFRRRFPEMHWAVLTPDESVSWDGTELRYGPGVPAKDAPPPDALEEMWKSYYRSTFNPARIKLKAMKKEIPVRHWPTLPETALIPAMLAEAPERVQTMLSYAEGPSQSAAAFLPARRDLPSLHEAAKGCTACKLCERATQTVFGEGPADARIVFVGEQPGDREDVEGRPFVGPAGLLFDEMLGEAGIARQAVYVTNAVKHFKFIERAATSYAGSVFREHHRADVREIAACQPWLGAELEVIKPKVIVCLGATATQSVLGRMFRFAERRGEVVDTATGAKAIATYHPAAILRAPADRAAAMREDLVRHVATARAVCG